MEAIRSIILWCTFFIVPSCLFSSISYQVQFSGVDNQEVLTALEKSSELLLLQNKEPPSIRALRYRAESDLPTLIKVLHAFGYFDASAYFEIAAESAPAIVEVFLYPGIRYKVGSFSLCYKDPKDKPLLLLEDLGIEKGSFVDSQNILRSNGKILRFLANHGYPLAHIEKESYSINRETKTLKGNFMIETGPKTYFGPLMIEGLKTVKADLIDRKILFDEGELYNENLVEASQKKLIETNLFSSVLFTHGETLDEDGELAVQLQIAESKHKNISLGVSYATIDGPGASIGWNNRNVLGEGEKLTFDLDVSKVYSVGSLAYIIPDFFRVNQYFLARAAISREDIRVYLARTYSLLQSVDRDIGEHGFLSSGIQFEYIDVNRSISNGQYSLISFPFAVRYRNVDSLLNPSKGASILYRSNSYIAVAHRKVSFVKQSLTMNHYLPLTPSRFLTFAFRAQIGSIAGTSLGSIPFNKRFLGGSDETLRGYSYKTVSPLDKDGDPTGGRSAIYGNFELRFRLSNQLGLVPFFDVGRVSEKTVPDFSGKWLKSVGIGLRYFLFFGPIRLDAGFPLNKRPLDDSYKIYISIGQTF